MVTKTQLQQLQNYMIAVKRLGRCLEKHELQEVKEWGRTLDYCHCGEWSYHRTGTCDECYQRYSD